MHVLPVPLQLLTGVGSMRINVPEDLRPLENRRAALNTLRVSHSWGLYLTPVPYMTVAIRAIRDSSRVLLGLRRSK